MAYRIYLVVILSCMLGLTKTQDETNTNTNNGNVFCWECTIERTMDNRLISMYDEVKHSTVQGNVCENHQCQSNQDWCLVTYYRVYAQDGQEEGKRERHECGNRNLRDTDTRCQQLLIEDKGHNKIVPRSCKTTRSGTISVYSVSLSVVLAIFSLAFLH